MESSLTALLYSKTFKKLLVSFVFGTSVALALPIAALYGLTAYVSTAIKWNNKLIRKFEKYER